MKRKQHVEMTEERMRYLSLLRADAALFGIGALLADVGLKGEVAAVARIRRKIASELERDQANAYSQFEKALRVRR